MYYGVRRLQIRLNGDYSLVRTVLAVSRDMWRCTLTRSHTKTFSFYASSQEPIKKKGTNERFLLALGSIPANLSHVRVEGGQIKAYRVTGVN